MNCDFTSSMDDSKFIPKATPIRLNKVREKEPMVSCRPRRIITFRWLESQGCCTESLDLQKALEWSMKSFTTHLKTNVLRFERNAKDEQSSTENEFTWFVCARPPVQVNRDDTFRVVY